MKRLRQNQQEYEQELISKGILPHTTEEAIRQYSEQQRAQIKTSKPIKSNSNNVRYPLYCFYNRIKHFINIISEKMFNRLCFIK